DAEMCGSVPKLAVTISFGRAASRETRFLRGGRRGARAPAHLWWGVHTMRLSTAAELRDDSRIAREIERKEADPELKILWAGHALALAQLAETIERREEAAREAA